MENKKSEDDAWIEYLRDVLFPSLLAGRVEFIKHCIWLFGGQCSDDNEEEKNSE